MSLNIVVHSFTNKLLESNRLSDESSWIEFYRFLWPEMLSAVRIDGKNKFQKWGIDRIIYLPNGKQILIDEKKNIADFDHFLCEEWSVGHYENGEKSKYIGSKIGWTLDPEKHTDYIAYAIIPLQKCYLIPFELLRITAKKNIERWKLLNVPSGKASQRDAHNNGYITRNCAVSWLELYRCIYRESCTYFNSKLALPEPIISDTGQMYLFEWGTPA